MIVKAYIQEYGNHSMEPEHLDVMQALVSKGIECEFFTNKKLVRNQLHIDETTLVVGDHPTLLTVFKKLGISVINDCYPESLRSYLNRNIWESSIRKLLAGNLNGHSGAVFVKPKSIPKLFTGFVTDPGTDLYQLHGIAKDTEIYCSSVVKWLVEYRVFVNQSNIVGIIKYLGDEQFLLNMDIVLQAIRDFELSKQRTAAYAVDFGVLEDGTTALIEWNDGFALGSYGLDKEVYTDMILARWEEISKQVLDLNQK